jgi:hypothetical protein
MSHFKIWMDCWRGAVDRGHWKSISVWSYKRTWMVEGNMEVKGGGVSKRVKAANREEEEELSDFVRRRAGICAAYKKMQFIRLKLTKNNKRHHMPLGPPISTPLLLMPPTAGLLLLTPSTAGLLPTPSTAGLLLPTSSPPALLLLMLSPLLATPDRHGWVLGLLL